MKIQTKIATLSLSLFLLAFQGIAWAEEVQVDHISLSELGAFPTNWKTYPFHYGKAEKVYKIAEEAGQKFIRAEDFDNISVPIFRDFNWDIQKYPYLKFSWRAKKLPAGAREVSKATNDSACAVYVGFGRTSAMKYVWSTSLSVGSFWEKDVGKFFIISKEMGANALGQWRSVTIAVPEDYQRYFRKNIKKPSGIGIMTDGNAMRQPAACDYKDFRISSHP